VNFDALYAILAEVARNHGQLTYGQLSQRYFDATGDWHEPHGSWDAPLGQLNQMLHAVRWPALSAVVVLQATNEPGGGFWESSPNIPPAPANALARTALYGQILTQVYAARWPVTLPTSPPT
jgi:hypothetical protein